MISEVIRKRLNFAKQRYFASDNISQFILQDEFNLLKEEVAEKFQGVLDSLIIDKEDPNSKDTAMRLSRMYIDELFSGRYEDKPKVTAFPNEGEKKYNGMLVERVEIKSVCAHHWQPVIGCAYIGIIPNGKVIGLSKYVRLAQWCARRGTLQEALTNDIAQEIIGATRCNDVGVHIRAEHGCMTNRGVMAHSSLTQSTVLFGLFNNLDVKNEFFQNIQMQVK